MISLAPHRLNRALRPSWFFDRPAYGGIINDIGVHSIDQFLALADVAEAEIESSTIGAFGTEPEGSRISPRSRCERHRCAAIAVWIGSRRMGCRPGAMGGCFWLAPMARWSCARTSIIEGRSGSNHMFVAGEASHSLPGLQCASGHLLPRRRRSGADAGLFRLAAGAGVHRLPHGAASASQCETLRRGAPGVIGLAIIGLGNALAPHAKALQDLADRVRVVHAVARNADQRRSVAEAYGFPTSDDTAAAIADPRVDAVMILTPTNAHLEIAEAAFSPRANTCCAKSRWKPLLHEQNVWWRAAGAPIGGLQ